MAGPVGRTPWSGASRLTAGLVVVLVVLTIASGVVWAKVLGGASPARPGSAAPLTSATPDAPSASGPTASGPSSAGPAADPEEALPRSPLPLADDLIVWRYNVGVNWTMSTISDTGTRGSVVLASGKQEIAPLVSYDRRTVLYLRRERPGDRTSVHAVAADGSVQRLLFRDGSPSCPYLRQVVWSVDGTLGLVCRTDQDGQTYTLSTARTDGTPLRTLDVGLIGSPTFSPDGRRILYPKASSGSYQRGGPLYVTDVDGSTEPTEVVGGRNLGPDWAPTGSRVAFAREDDDTTHVVTMPVDGSADDIDVLTDGDESDIDPSWSPDGRSLAFRRGSEEDGYRLVVMTSTGDRERELSHDGTVGTPCWTPR